MSKKKKLKKVPKPKQLEIKSTGLIPSQGGKLMNVEEKKMIFQFEYPQWLKSFQYKDFTTFLKDENMYSSSITYLFSDLIPKITYEWQVNKSSREWQHFHKISEGEALGRYNRAIRNLHPKISIDSLELWQFGMTYNPLRLICHKQPNTNILFPLLIDYHHLGYVDKNYNQTDYSTYKYCPLTSYKK